MTETRNLLKLKADELTAADLLRVFSQSYGGDVALPLAQMIAHLNKALNRGDLTTVYAAPSADGFTVTLDQIDAWLVLTPSGPLASGAIALPAGEDRAEVLVNCTQDVSALSLLVQPGSSVHGGPTALAAGDFFRLRFDATVRAWYRVG